jgi:para-nitrobenzyl esterase
MLAANILLAICVTTAGEARVTKYVVEDPTERNSVKVNLGAACDPGTTVQTDRGTVCGIVVNGINSWQGIPFAAPPVENLRFAPPQPAAAWSGTLQATAFASQCTQTSGGNEDCLYLNVWAQPGAQNLPVMAHIHGGGFRNGSGADDFSLLSGTGNVVVVSLNYRLNIFGFAANRAFGPNSGDYGLQDQQAALQWIQRNVSAFGGDPNSVTIFGESAGGSSVCDQIASPTAAGLFHKGISTSGQYNTIYETPESAGPLGTTLEVQDCKSRLPSLGLAELIGDQFATALGCTGTDVAACVRAVDAATVFNVAGLGYQYGGFGTIAPTINGTTLVASLPQLLDTGSVNRVPVIFGTDRDENLAGTANTAADYADLIQAQFGQWASEVTARYPLNRFASPGIAWRTIAADAYTVCSELRTVGAVSQWMPAYQYLIEYAAPWPPAYTGVPSGAGHVRAWALTPVLPSTTLPGGLDNNQEPIQDEEIAHVSALARTGNPTADGTPIWPQFTEGLVLSLNAGGSSQATSVSDISRIHNCAFWDALTPVTDADSD